MTVDIDWSDVSGQKKSLSVPSDVVSLDLASREIKEIDLQMLSNFPSLRVLSLRQNFLSKLDLSPISNCSQIRAILPQAPGRHV